MRIGAPLSFVLADSGIVGLTAEAVGAVRMRREQNPEGMETLLSWPASIAEGAIDDLALGDHEAIGAACATRTRCCTQLRQP